MKLIKNAELDWKPIVKEILFSYTENTPGCFIEEKESMLVWNYEEVDNEFGIW